MLISFTVKNFRSIKEKVVLNLQATNDSAMKESSIIETDNISLLKSVAIYGANASGKSNVMKAFVAFQKMILDSFMKANSTSPLPSEIFKLNTETATEPSFFEMKFLLNEEVYLYGFEINQREVVKEWLKQEKGNKILFNRTQQTIETNKNYFKEASAAFKKQTSERVLFLSLLANYNTPTAKVIIKLLQNSNYISGTDRGATLNYAFGKFLEGGNVTKKMKEIMTEADFGIVDIEADQKTVSVDEIKNIPDKFKALFLEDNPKMFERKLEFLHKKYDKNKKEVGFQSLDFFSEESEGTQQMFSLAAPIIDTLENGKILLIDEVDSSLHPYLCQYLIAIFNSKEKNPNNAQLIFTTHDISLLDENLLRRDQVYFTEKNKYGETELFSLSDIKERKGVNFSKRYMEGRYNALPYIKPFEDLKFNKND